MNLGILVNILFILLIRKEEIYKSMEISERRRIFNKMIAFIRAIDKNQCFVSDLLV